ncbi:MAG: GNAT family N-acetyltransferase, partial [Actinomycetota bacterium]|nr:GNAT family N-acetyltransferase [Actinomycetota bacterium]
MVFPHDVPVLSDGTVSLRAHHRGDLDGIVEQCTDPLSIEWTTVPVPYTLAHAAEWVDQRIPKAWSDGSDLCFAIETEGRFAGSTSLRPEGD